MTDPSESHLYDEIRALLAPLQDMQRRHQQRIAAHKNADGDVIDEQYAQHEDARHDTAIEASDTLDTVITRLHLLTATPARRAFTVAVTGPGHADGERPWLFVVHATDLNDAHRGLVQLPAFQHWLLDTKTSHDYAVLVPSECHPGTRAPGSYLDLRHEQARILAERSPLPATAAPVQPANPTSRTR
ncbi:hypothetical protein NLX86_25910 [Streptomyces sp. A3M-1-3]|uniref:hypothetical protein n=1 Tax=Streptomyces sp. A3M-1-3 TaxID=2962044 RepID=UPI0020B85AF2|nr:hypothetical protein [Streptomyces sp. A3M-1-3]MCP3821406.1 hypothetical protein [Streptomyces sp. A3M-1-3]